MDYPTLKFFVTASFLFLYLELCLGPTINVPKKLVIVATATIQYKRFFLYFTFLYYTYDFMNYYLVLLLL